MSKSKAKSWAKIAAQLGKALPAERLHPRVRNWIAKQNGNSETWAVAVSGGADSVALLLLLWAHFPKKSKQLLVLHFDHATRPDSAEDAKFVQKLAASLKVLFKSARRVESGQASEAALREARWKFFREQLAAQKARVLFFGHQSDDIAETMLMRLARGSGAGGLSAPRPTRIFPDGVVALRPLLDIKHDELVNNLKSVGASWREDSSNAQDDYLRNRIRHQVIPAWRAAIAPRDLDTCVARSREALEDDDEALNNLAEAIMRDQRAGAPLPLQRLANQPRAICRRVLRSWLWQNGVESNLNAQAFEVLLDSVMAARPGQWSAGADRWIIADEKAVSVRERSRQMIGVRKPLVLKPGNTINWPNGSRLESRIVKLDRKLLTALKSAKINPTKCAYLAMPNGSRQIVFSVRNWRPGDRYQPLGGPGRRKLQDLFTDKKVPTEERRRLPVVCNVDNEPLWVPGLAPAHSHRVTEDTQTALELTYHPPQERITRLTPT